MDVSTPRLWMLSGERGAGKTSFCRSLAAHAHLQGWDVAGLVSPAVFEGEIKTGILAEDLRTGETRSLAAAKQHLSFDLQMGMWFFNRSTLAWGNQVIQQSTSCHLLIIDELGLLELTHQEGWQAALDVLRGHEYQTALAVVRPELQEIARQFLSFSETIAIDHTQTIEQWVRFYWPKIKTAFAPKNQLRNAP